MSPLHRRPPRLLSLFDTWYGSLNCTSKMNITVHTWSQKSDFMAEGLVGQVTSGTYLNCAADGSVTLSVPSDCGGIAGRVAGRLSNCYSLGTGKFTPENAISYASWTDDPVANCIDMTKAASAQKENFYRSCGWDFTNIWDKSGTYPILRAMDRAAQEANR